MACALCATPMLVVLLGLVASRGNLEWGIMLLLLYSVGHSALVIAAGTSVGFVKRITLSPKYGRFSKAIKVILGGLIMAIGLYMLSLGL
ncbi:MAG TPA: cytochrome c biogenesis protein CcdA [Clostridia bacterium]|nr:cytochrome c biogenesis protein CcdA [Clostridia bacterium]